MPCQRRVVAAYLLIRKAVGVSDSTEGVEEEWSENDASAEEEKREDGEALTVVVVSRMKAVMVGEWSVRE